MLRILALALVVGVAAPVVQVPNVVGLPYEQAKRVVLTCPTTDGQASVLTDVQDRRKAST
jgi:hypothetical protein